MNKNDKLLIGLHIIWFESMMINETLDSIAEAIENSILDVDVLICLNQQTLMDKPKPGIVPSKLFDEFMEHPVMKRAEIFRKTDQDPLYKGADFRREVYGEKYDYKYVVWGETDALIPEDYFFILSHTEIDHPHIVTLSTRKMWDYTWDEIEHEWIKQFPRNGPPDRPEQAPHPFNFADYITQKELNEFNRKFDEPYLVKMDRLKIDGNLTALSRGLPYPFLPSDLHLGHDDYCMQMFFQIKGIPQYHCANRLKGHNQTHPKKKFGVEETNKELYDDMMKQTHQSIINFLRNTKP